MYVQLFYVYTKFIKKKKKKNCVDFARENRIVPSINIKKEKHKVFRFHLVPFFLGIVVRINV